MSLLEALGYVGDTLAKPGRAVRGALGGRPEEILAAIPFSDSLGITDPTQQVRGRDLLNQLGFTDPNDDGWGSMLGGLGVDLATDPLTYLGGAAARGVVGALSAGKTVIPAELAAARAAEAAAGQFDLVDPIGRLANPADELMRGASSPWSPGTPKGGIDLGPLAPMDVPPIPPPAPPINLRGPSEIDELFAPDPFRTHFGAEYSTAAEMGTPHWGNSMANDALAIDGDPNLAFNVSLGSWDNQIEQLERLSPTARAQLLGDGGASAGNPEWQSLLMGRRGDLEAAEAMAQLGIIPEEYAKLAAAQAARLAPFSTWSTENQAAKLLMRDLASGVYPPRAAVERFQETVPYLPFQEAQVRRAAALAQEEGMRQSIPRTIGSMAGELDEAVTPSFVDNLANVYEPDYLIRQLDHLIDARAWTDLEYVEPNIARRVLAETAEQGETGALVEALRRLMGNARTSPRRGMGGGAFIPEAPAGFDPFDMDGVIELTDFA